ncbi:tyrosine-protein phosphatase [Actinocorallia sp. A-T 12471]|uniref:tyrosine-protein phosphatase n=1 Tax=Actinocorallia sp. A-T 12471 TaxID=3089813 RepID=UPI0029CBE713|nr:tyrosine-protein phosphatase [Actinocorallia sp. A-T 12471]MDX6742182.1 tyrosine-protein phosphatase [Actinocorallia sp. A-T 12471]
MNNLTSVKAVSTLAATAALLLGSAATGAAATPHPTHDHKTKGQHSARIPFTKATVKANNDGSFTITWKAPGVKRVAVKAAGRTVARGDNAETVRVKGLPKADRQWFELVPDRGGSLRLADRLVKLNGTVNFRDVGGYRTTNGKWVRMGKVYRTDALDKLTSADLAKLKRLGIKVAYDLRMDAERAAAPDKLPAGVRYVVADVAGGGAYTGMPTTPEAAADLMIEGEKAMVTSPSAKKALSTVFDGLADKRARALLFHCTAGKDRTGWAAASLLTALGVPRATVMADYLASNDYRAAANAAALAALPPAQAAIYKPLLDVRAEYLNAGFAQVKKSFGTFSGYEKKGLGLSKAELKELKDSLLVG